MRASSPAPSRCRRCLPLRADGASRVVGIARDSGARFAVTSAEILEPLRLAWGASAGPPLVWLTVADLCRRRRLRVARSGHPPGSRGVPPVHARGDEVWVVGGFRSTANETGLACSDPLVHVFTVRGGRLVAFREHCDARITLAAYRPDLYPAQAAVTD